MFPPSPCLYVILSSSLTSRPLSEVAEEVIQGGAKILQLREKNLEDAEFLEVAKKLKEITSKSNTLFIINDRIDIALLCDAHGVHLGQEDTPLLEARKELGPGKILGASARTVELARKAQADGADYLGCGAAFSTSTKEDALVIGPEKIAEIASSVEIPLFAIGGITAENLSHLPFPPLYGVAVSSAVVSAEKAGEKARELVKLLEKK